MLHNTTFRAAAVQMHSGADRAENVTIAERLVREAADRGAQLVVLPEYFNLLSTLKEMAQQSEAIPGPSIAAMQTLAAELRIYLQAGSVCETITGSAKAFNTSVLIAPGGEIVSCYRKLHLFDVDLPGRITNQESLCLEPGRDTVVDETPLGHWGHATCYDLRFPELFRRMTDEGMEVLVFPSAFSAPTGEAHWKPLLRARAIENQVYVIAANQFGRHTPAFSSHGHSMIVDPWGEVLTEADGETETVLVAEIDVARLADIRRQLPCLRHRRRELN